MSDTGDLIASLRKQAPQVVRLATVVSIASRIEPILMRRARLERCPGVDAGVEIDLWHSSLVEARSSVAMTLRPAVAASLQKEYRDDADLQAAYDLVRDCHAQLPEAIRIEEEITWRLLSVSHGDSTKVTRLLQKATNSLVDGSQPDLAAWVARFLPRAPEDIRKLPASWVLGLAASSRLGGVQVMPGKDLPENVESEELFWALSQTEKTAELFVGRDENELLFSVTPPEDASSRFHSIPIPATNPIVIELDDRTDGGRRLERLAPDGTEILRVRLTGPELQLRTAVGDVYLISGPVATEAAAQDDSKRVPPDKADLPLCPFPGMRPFMPSEAEIFFGREEDTEELLRRLEEHRFVMVTGPSGSGKSSLIRAGLLPAIDEGFLTDRGVAHTAVTRPGNRPMENLAAAIADTVFPSGVDDPMENREPVLQALQSGVEGLAGLLREIPDSVQAALLIVVDQFEEIFRLRSGEQREDSRSFVSLLLECSRQTDWPIYLVLSMRSDFLSDASTFEELAGALNESQYLVPSLSRSGLRDAVTKPLQLYGGLIEADLVERILNDFGAENPDLAVLQHCLLRLWNVVQLHEAGQALITNDVYEEIGGCFAALSQHADEAFHELDEEDRRIAELMFRKLTARDEAQRVLRYPTRMESIASVAEVDLKTVDRVASHFNRSDRQFIMPSAYTPLTGDTVLDVTHESLIRHWSRLSKWAEKEAASADFYLRLARTAEDWERGKAALLPAKDLAEALEWRETERPNAAWAERYGRDFELTMKFLEASRAREASRAPKSRKDKRELSRRLAETFDFLYYISCASRENESAALDRLLRQLEKEVRKRSGVKSKQISFLDMTSLGTGEHLGDRLEQALRGSAVLVSVVSPQYFLSEFTGLEFGFFVEREKRLNLSTPGILPVSWSPLSEPLPPAVSRLQIFDDDAPKLYYERGAKHVMEGGGQSAINQLVSWLAERIVNLAEQVQPQFGPDRLPALKEIENAWDTPQS